MYGAKPSGRGVDMGITPRSCVQAGSYVFMARG